MDFPIVPAGLLVCRRFGCPAPSFETISPGLIEAARKPATADRLAIPANVAVSPLPSTEPTTGSPSMPIAGIQFPLAGSTLNSASDAPGVLGRAERQDDRQTRSRQRKRWLGPQRDVDKRRSGCGVPRRVVRQGGILEHLNRDVGLVEQDACGGCNRRRTLAVGRRSAGEAHGIIDAIGLEDLQDVAEAGSWNVDAPGDIACFVDPA